MNASALAWNILWPAVAAGVLVSATHVPLGMQVLRRGIVFIDLAIAQIAGLGVIVGDWIGLEARGGAVQVCALSAAVTGALLLVWSEKRWPEVQEAIIGVSFVLAASGALLLLAANPHGSEHLKELLVGQILWAGIRELALVAAIYAVVLLVWLLGSDAIGRIGFYVLFACTVTLSVQLVGLYLVFATLIVPALATRRMTRHRVAAGYVISVLGYVAGLVLATLVDLPAGPAIVWVMTMVAMAFAVTSASRGSR